MAAYTHDELTAFTDWCAHRAYIDGNRNYHVKGTTGSGPIAPWNKAIKRRYPTFQAFIGAVRSWQATT